jgi:adenosine kinase
VKTLICGSLAYDTIMVFPDRFSRHILPDQAHVLSVSFTVGEMRREWGGCAGNIAYNLKALGGSPVVMATLGDDGADYRNRLASLGIGTEGVRDVPGSFTAQAFIITDLDDNQITAFHPGAMTRSHDSHVGDVSGVGWGIIAPDGRDGMLQHAAEFRDAGIPYLFDPGQGITLFDGDELLEMVDGAAVVACNDYEGKLLCERTGLSLEDIAAHVDALAVTMGGEGSVIHVDGASVLIPPAKASAVVDPTGCGDAYRAGILY